MTSKIVYTIVFLMAFLLVTISIIIMNDHYTNIFAFDFRPAAEIDSKQKKNNIPKGPEDLKTLISDMKDELLDSIKNLKQPPRIDTIFTESKKDPGVIDSIKKITSKVEIIEKELIAKNNEILNLRSVKKANQDSAYVKWKRDMVKIYESMDSKAAARIIQNLEDSQAKDILFSMKKKKAAEIIMKLNPETASRITRME